MQIDLENMTTLELMRRYTAIIDELMKRGIVRTYNAPIGDYTEYLVAQTLGLTLTGNSKADYDASDAAGLRYQIKSRRISISHPTMQLGAIRNLEAHGFDFLIAILFRLDFTIHVVVKIPYDTVCFYGRYVKHTNSHILTLREEILNDDRVEHITHLFC